LQDNDERMKADYDVNQPIEVLIDQIDDAVDMASAADAAYTPVQVVTTAYTLVLKTGMFPDDCKAWRRLTTAEKTWTAFKPIFTLAHQELRDALHTSKSAGLQSANNAMESDQHNIQQDTVDAIANLATATAANRSTVATLSATNSKLVAEILVLNAKLVKALEANRNGGPDRSGRNERNGRTGQKKQGPHYCYRCGSGIWHPS
jgi:hypothetical protein